MMLNQVGDVASSKSAIHTFAPQFSAPIVILRVGGPVISHRLSSSPGAGAATCQVWSRRMSAVSAEKSTVLPWSAGGLATRDRRAPNLR